MSATANRILFTLLVFGGLATSATAQALEPVSRISANQSVARKWDEMILEGVRNDLARPTVTARNLFNFSAAMYDAWAIYDRNAQTYYVDFKVSPPPGVSIESARRESISYAAYRVLRERFSKAPGAAKVLPQFDRLMADFGYDIAKTSTSGNSPADFGNRVAAIVIEKCLADGSREDAGYSNPAGAYIPTNPPLPVTLPGVSNLRDVNHWQPLALAVNIDQNGNVIPGNVQTELTPFWGQLRPFSLGAQDKSPKPGVWLDPGPPPQFGGPGDAIYRNAMEEVAILSGWLDPRDSVRLDISPANLGNNGLGTNNGHGYRINPVTKRPYERQLVLRGDYTRVLAEFWADGPTSETPPGHWNVIANYVEDHPSFERRWAGRGRQLDPLEWDVKMYLTLNGALYDASITAWGLKGFYDGSRPITAIRYLSSLGQATDPTLPSFNPAGIHLSPGAIEVITSETTAPGARHERLRGHEGEIAIYAWQGSPANPALQFSGAGWILGINWLPYQRPTFVTPPFAGYISGHSTFSRAAAEVLTEITGSAFFPGGMGSFVAKQNAYLVFEAGPTRTIELQWATYYDAADQSARSRLLGGIHGYLDDFPGRKIGSIIGKKAVARAVSLF